MRTASPSAVRSANAPGVWTPPSLWSPSKFGQCRRSEPLTFLSGCTLVPPCSTVWILLDLFFYVPLFFTLNIVVRPCVAAHGGLSGPPALQRFGFGPWAISYSLLIRWRLPC